MISSRFSPDNASDPSGGRHAESAKFPLPIGKKRINWGEAHKDWEAVIFSNESKFNIFGSAGFNTV
jgi:hypothetical protein